tara:strand:- start:7698 stop:7886 length:189 start_codon:yes stop_codon:yes gene_type:complete
MALVAGKNLVPSPPTGNTAFLNLLTTGYSPSNAGTDLEFLKHMNSTEFVPRAIRVCKQRQGD